MTLKASANQLLVLLQDGRHIMAKRTLSVADASEKREDRVAEAALWPLLREIDSWPNQTFRRMRLPTHPGTAKGKERVTRHGLEPGRKSGRRTGPPAIRPTSSREKRGADRPADNAALAAGMIGRGSVDYGCSGIDSRSAVAALRRFTKPRVAIERCELSRRLEPRARALSRDGEARVACPARRVPFC